MTGPGNFYVFSGGPGSGKTTLLGALAAEGYIVMPEVAREIIREQVAAGGRGLPWADREHYTDLMLRASIALYRAAELRGIQEKGPFCFDRGIPDALAYAAMIGYNPPEALLSEALDCRYHHKVFMLPPWRDIYTTDTERKQSWEEALQTQHILTKTYKNLGYETVTVPRLALAARSRFVQEHLDLAKG